MSQVFFLENLPLALQRIFIPQCSLPLPHEAFPYFARCMGVPNIPKSQKCILSMYACTDSLESLLVKYPEKNFVRLGSRSPKDVPPLIVGMKVGNVKEAFSLLTERDRINEDDSIKIIDYNPLTQNTGKCLFNSRLSPSVTPQLRFLVKETVMAVSLPEENTA